MKKTETFLDRLADVVRERRLRLNMTQNELGEAAGLQRTYIGDVERGFRNISVKNLARIAEALQFRSVTQIINASDPDRD